MPDRETVVRCFEFCRVEDKCSTDCPYCDNNGSARECTKELAKDVLTLLKEQEAVEPKTIPEELKLKMWNALYAKEDKFEEKYIGTKEQNSWFLIYRPWLQEGFNLAIKAIADWEGG